MEVGASLDPGRAGGQAIASQRLRKNPKGGTHPSTSKSFIWPAKLVGNAEASNRVMESIPLVPASKLHKPTFPQKELPDNS